jgi:hypothetical protein
MQHFALILQALHFPALGSNLRLQYTVLLHKDDVTHIPKHSKKRPSAQSLVSRSQQT